MACIERMAERINNDKWEMYGKLISITKHWMYSWNKKWWILTSIGCMAKPINIDMCIICRQID